MSEKKDHSALYFLVIILSFVTLFCLGLTFLINQNDTEILELENEKLKLEILKQEIEILKLKSKNQ
jgi:hypothetical protein